MEPADSLNTSPLDTPADHFLEADGIERDQAEAIGNSIRNGQGGLDVKAGLAFAIVAARPLPAGAGSSTRSAGLH